MKGKKEKLARIFKKTGINHALGLIPLSHLIVLNYHRIYNDVLDTLFDEQVFGPSVEEFEQQILWLKEVASVLSEEDLLRIVRDQKPLPRRSALITFDDGYKDNYELAVPILKKLAVPAIFFIPTQIVNERKLGWWDIISYLVKRTNRSYIKFNGCEFSFNNDSERFSAIGKILKIMKTSKYETTKDLVEKLAESCRVEMPSQTMQSDQLMTWDEIKDSSRNGIAIGSHTVSHRVLAMIDPAEQKIELEESKAALEDHLGHPIHSLSYPVGGYSSFTHETKSLAMAAGYTIAFSFNTGYNHHRISDPFNVKRIAPPQDWTVFQTTFMAPRLFIQNGFERK
jgi:peptidoglycan/xylan/chitin deacetylase (PgdA/CDA1 family)